MSFPSRHEATTIYDVEMETAYTLHAWPHTCVRGALYLGFEGLPFVIAIPLVFPRL